MSYMSLLSLYVTIRAVSLLFILAIVQLLKKIKRNNLEYRCAFEAKKIDKMYCVGWSRQKQNWRTVLAHLICGFVIVFKKWCLISTSWERGSMFIFTLLVSSLETCTYLLIKCKIPGKTFEDRRVNLSLGIFLVKYEW